MVKVNLVIENKNWKSRYPKINLFLIKSIKKIISSIFSSRAIAFEISISIHVLDQPKLVTHIVRSIRPMGPPKREILPGA